MPQKRTAKRRCQSTAASSILQREVMYRFRYQRKACLIRVATRVEKCLAPRQLHQPVFANKIVDDLSGLLREGRIKGQTAVDLRPALQDRAIRGGLAPCQQ